MAHKRRVRAAEQAKQVKEILVATTAVGGKPDAGFAEALDEALIEGREPGLFQGFGQRPTSPSRGPNRYHSQNSLPSHPNSLELEDEEPQIDSDMERGERSHEGKEQ